MSSLGHGIRPIETESVGNITAGQVIVDLQSAVKELVENSLDAKATSIEVRLKDSGLTLIEVVDNGEGIASDDYASVALRHATSKLSSFEDLTSVHSFGFRGEALFSLCASAERVTITTSTGANGPMGAILEFDQYGKLVSSDRKVARTRGTTVSVHNVFFVATVRKKEAQRNAKREMDRILRLMHAYTLVPCTRQNGGVKLILTNQSSNGKKTVPLGNQAQRTTSLRQAVSNLWTSKALDHLVEVDLEFEVEVAKTVLRRRALHKSSIGHNIVRVRGLISKFSVGYGRSSTDRQFFFVNGRPCDPTKVAKAINGVYKTFNMTQYPFVVADFIVPTDACDINVSPDKRQILLHSEDNLIEALKRALQEKFGDARSTFCLNNTHVAPSSSQRSLSRSSSRAVPDADAPPARPRLRKPVNSDSLDVDEDMGDQQTPSAEPEADNAPRLAERSSSPAPKRDPASAPKDVIVPSSFAKAKTAPHTRLTSPEPLSTSYAGRRSPAQIERIVSAAPSRPTSSRHHDVQMVLDTSGAAWNLRRESSEPPRKRPRVVDEPEVQRGASFSSSSSNTSRLARASLRDKLKNLARTGSNALLENTGNVGDADADDVETNERGGSEQIEDADEQRNDSDHCGASSPPIRAILVDPETKTDSSWTQEDQLAAETPMDVDNEPVHAPSRRQTPRLSSQHPSPPPASTLLPSGRPSTPLFLSNDEDCEPISEPKRTTDEREPSPPIDYDLSSDLYVDPVLSSRRETQDGEPELGAPSPGLFRRAKVEDTHSSGVVAETEPLSADEGEGDDITRTVEDSCDVTVPFDLERLKAFWETRQLLPFSATTPVNVATMQANDPQQNEAAGLANTDDEAAADALARVLSKDDFARMEIAGQFNKGFIIGRRQTDTLDDLFIIDQHAADEKYNFETLQQTTKIESQRLYKREALELPAADALVAVDNIDILRQNGFEVEIEEGEDGDDTVRRVVLLAKPVSKGTTFDERDLEELIHKMRDLPTGTMVRPTRIRAMFASRSCRKSVMVGHTLTKQQMTTIVGHMADMDQPWHCPHGRPTMRHLADISSLSRRGPKGVNWATVHVDDNSVDRTFARDSLGHES